MQKYNILWVDDEIDLLKPHIIFLEEKGYQVTPVYNGRDALEKCREADFDMVFLDEQMPGMSGLETLNQLKESHPSLPVIMITKSEEESIMEQAIGARIDNYLIKPLNPHQILLAVKKQLENRKIFTEKTNISYQQEFQKISEAFADDLDFEDWVDLYRKLIYWELEIEQTENKSMKDILDDQKLEANTNFTKFIKEHYVDWVNKKAEGPLMSPDVFDKKVFPWLQEEDSVFVVVIDNLRYDQWRTLLPVISEYFRVEEEDAYLSILPTTTNYARNAMFSGLMPGNIQKQYPDYWVFDVDDEGKNDYEEYFLGEQLKNKGYTNTKYSYHKITRAHQGNQLLNKISDLFNNDLNVLVYNFVDMLSHARTDNAMIKELAPDEAAYRSLTRSWFDHSPLIEALRLLSEKNARVVLTTDHGTIRAKRPSKIIGDRDTNTNLRFKYGKNLNYEKKHVFAGEPEDFKLPRRNVSTKFVFGTEDYFFAYPNNYNYYVKYFRDTFQHGGLSLEEMIVPVVTLSSRYG